MALEIGANLMAIDAIAERLAAVFAGDLEDVRVQEPDTVVARCDKAKLKDVARRLKAEPRSATRRSTGSPGSIGSRVSKACTTSTAGRPTRTSSCTSSCRADAEVETVCDVWPAAEWLEREAWDMFGIRFTGHPDLRRILLKDDFVGYPLRKDYVDLVENHPHA